MKRIGERVAWNLRVPNKRTAGARFNALSQAHQDMVATLRALVFEESAALDLPRRSKAVGLELSDIQLVRWLESAEWKMSYSDGNTVLNSIISTVAWREKRAIWAYVTDARKRATLAPLLGRGGMFFTTGLDLKGGAPLFIRPANIDAVPEKDLPLVPDLVLYCVERCELASRKAGHEGARMTVYLDCGKCSLNTLRRWAQAVPYCVS